MKKITLIISVLAIAVSLTIILIRNLPIKPFFLNDEYYLNAQIKEIELEELEDLIKQNQSFGLLVYQPICIVSSSFSKIVEEYSNTNNLTFYKIAFNKIKDTDLNKKITYYPSFVLYKKGKVKTYLDATNNEDIKFFSSINGFNTWINKYLKLKNKTNQNDENNTPEIPDENNSEKDKIILKDVTKEEGKVNIYFFWGNGCPHCKKEFEFLNEIEEEYGSLFNLYTYEVWYNEENQKILKSFENVLNTDIEGGPLTIIGNQVFSGFWDSRKEEIKNVITTESKNNYDIYFDKILNKDE